jgi:hypothetical protein
MIEDSGNSDRVAQQKNCVTIGRCSPSNALSLHILT